MLVKYFKGFRGKVTRKHCGSCVCFFFLIWVWPLALLQLSGSKLLKFFSIVLNGPFYFHRRLQKFKMNIANTVITQDNSSLKFMGTDQLLDLFSLDSSGSEPGQEKLESKSRKGSIKNILESMEELRDETQYETEYNLDSFMHSLSK